MSFAWPYVLIALPFVLAGLVALFASSRRARTRLLGRFASTRLLPVLMTSYSPVLRAIKHLLIAGGVVLTVVALARPQWGYDWQQNMSRGVDVVFVLDTSRSMLTPDVQPNRLERAKLAIYDLVQKMPGNRVGLVAFAGDAFLQCPLTLDYDAFRQTLDAVDTNTIARGGSDIAVGLDAAATALEKSGNHKIIVLLTDGEDLEGQGVEEAKTLAKQGIVIYTVGVGTAKGEVIPIPGGNGGTDFVRDQRGDLVTSKLDSTTLSDIANATHGFYEPLGPTGQGLERVYEDGIKKLPEQNLESQISRQPIERYQWPLAIGTVLLAMEMLVGTRRPAWRRRAMPAAILTEPLPVATLPTKSPKTETGSKVPPAMVGLLLLALLMPGVARAQSATKQAETPADNATPATAAGSDTSNPAPAPTKVSPVAAENLFNQGDYSAAASAYNQAAQTAPNDGRFPYDQGESLYRSKDYEAAAQAFVKSLSSSDLALQQRAYYNLGNAHYRLGQAQLKDDPQKTMDTWGAAIKDYQNALDLDGSDADARYNLDLVKKKLDDLKKQQDQQKQQQQNQQNQNNQNQNQQNQDQKNQQNQNNQNQQNQNQNQQNQQNQSNQNQQNQNQSGQNGQNQQNQSKNSGNSPQNQQNNSNPQNQSGGQNSPDKQNQGQQKPGDQKQNQQNGDQSKDQQNGNQPKDQQNGQNGNQKQPQPAPGQGQQPQNGQQQKPNQPASSPPAGTNSGKEPTKQNAGQSSAGASSSSGTSGNATANGRVMVGVMTREEAQQLLDSLKPDERKLPAARTDAASQNSSSDQTFKDW